MRMAIAKRVTWADLLFATCFIFPLLRGQDRTHGRWTANGNARKCSRFHRLPLNAVLCRGGYISSYNRVPGFAMGERSAGISPSIRSPEDRLDSWKEIAAYLNRDVTTVQRWEKREGMPVHRHVHDRAGSVYAFREELDDWARSRSPRGRESSQGETTSPGADPGTTAEPAGRRVSHIVAAGLAAGLILSAVFWLRSEDYFWRNPLSGAKFRQFTDFDGVAEAAAISRDGHFVAFLSDRDGPMDVWVSQVGSGQFHNLTKGSEPELMNPSVRTLGFSP